MKPKTILSIMGLAAGSALILALVLVTGGSAGLYHVGASGNLYCYDCHTIHFSQTHNWDGTTPVPTTPAPNGNWLGGAGPNEFLLKLPANELCLTCHNGQTFAPDVFGVNANASPSNGRQAGALNDTVGTGPYESWKGHTLGSIAIPPGYNPSAIGWTGSYNPTGGLECTNCHLQHGSASVYRNLGPRSFSAGNPSFVVDTTNDTTKDVWVNIPNTYAAGSNSAATFNPYYATANINFNRNDTTVTSKKSSNKMGIFCATCHANFHGGGGNDNIGGSAGASNLEGFLRHPTAQATIGAAGGAGYGGHSSLTRFVANTTKVKVNTTNYTTYADASPFCLSCHKGHGNQNPFGLIFLNRNATSVDEQGGIASGQTADVPTGYRNLCGQCHGQGN